MNIQTTCICGATHVVTVDSQDYLAWKNGEYIQVALPYLNADERELLISGICSTCWDNMFAEM